MGNEMNVCRTAVMKNKPTQVIGMPKRERIGADILLCDQYSLPLNPADSTTLKSRKTNLRNEVTSSVLSFQMSRYQPYALLRKDYPRSKCLW